MGALAQANIFGTMAGILGTINRKNAKFQEQVDSANQNMKNMHLPSRL